MQTDVTRGDKLVGLFVLGALVLGVGFAVAANSDDFVGKRRYVLVLEQTYDLREGSKVEWRGMTIGEVERVQPDLSRNVVEVVFRVDKPENYNRIKTDAVFQIQGALGPLKAASIALIEPGSQDAETMGDMASIAWMPPTASFEDLAADVTEVVQQFRILSSRLTDEQRNGILELLGPDTSATIQHMIESVAHTVDEDLLPTTASLRNIVSDLEGGVRSVADVMVGDRPLAQVLLGEEVQGALRRVGAGESSVLELVMGRDVWTERAAGLSQIEQEVLTMLRHTDQSLGIAHGMLEEMRPLTRALGESDAVMGSLLGRTDTLLADLNVLTGALASSSHEVPVLMRSTRQLLNNTDDLVSALQRHWLISGFVTQKPEQGFGLRRSTRPNPYHE